MTDPQLLLHIDDGGDTGGHPGFTCAHCMAWVTRFTEECPHRLRVALDAATATSAPGGWSATDRVLGPPGVLPPDDWCVGARVRYLDHLWVVVAVDRSYARHDSLLLADPTVPRVPDVYYARSLFSLDLTAGAIDFGVRALWYLLLQGSQPLTAPTWEIQPDGGLWLDNLYCCEQDDPMLLNYVTECKTEGLSVSLLTDGFVVVPGIAAETDARRALAHALSTLKQQRTVLEVVSPP